MPSISNHIREQLLRFLTWQPNAYMESASSSSISTVRSATIMATFVNQSSTLWIRNGIHPLLKLSKHKIPILHLHKSLYCPQGIPLKASIIECNDESFNSPWPWNGLDPASRQQTKTACSQFLARLYYWLQFDFSIMDTATCHCWFQFVISTRSNWIWRVCFQTPTKSSYSKWRSVTESTK
jgi:hypothetical protein